MCEWALETLCDELVACISDNEMDCSGNRALKNSKVNLKVFRRGFQLIGTLMWSIEQCFTRLRLYSTLIYPSSSELYNISSSYRLLLELRVMNDVR